ncbi:MAG: hypothetical protein JRC87_00790 [Deltaproteobacteria bacterium]|nr:hypothetical protein [Deltaproteobacteria bacterium]MBW2658126.1 hypothetical protein [Deltaproteobacteria bacterium]
MSTFVKKYQNVIIFIILVAFFFFMIGIGIYLQKRSSRPVAFRSGLSAVNIRETPSRKSSLKSREGNYDSTTFFLEPSPEQLMVQISKLDFIDERIATKKFSGLKVMWPLYFFNFQEKKGNTVTARFDAVENGFGLMVTCSMDADKFPLMADVKSGDKIWVAGEIIAVDPAGTGMIYMTTDHIRLTEPVAASVD